MRTRGFTLIELLVALAIMAIISAVAVPIYTEYSVRTQRTNAEKDLMLCAQSMERLASATFTYAGHVGGGDTGAVTANVCVPIDDDVFGRRHGRECEHVHDSCDADVGAGRWATACSRSMRAARSDGTETTMGTLVTRTKRGGRTDLGRACGQRDLAGRYIRVTPLILQESSIHRRSLSSPPRLP